MRDKRKLPENSGEYDALLDAALQTYADASPREGLEARILARKAESAREPRAFAGWRFALAAAVLIALAGMVLPLSFRQHAQPAPQGIAAAKRSALPRAFAPAKIEHTRASATPVHKIRPRTRPAVSKPFVPVPLSTQERLLLQLAASPQHPLANLNSSAPIEIQPIEISAIQIKPLSRDTASN